MGNTHLQNDHLHIYIETEKQFYNSGSSIEGVVFVEAQSNFPFDALYLRVEGDQWCQWFEGSSKNRHKYTGNQNFYSIEHLLERYEDRVLAAGKYAYPFSIELSQNIPGSFESSNYDARIEYKLVAYFTNFNQWQHRQMESVPLLIRQPFRQDVVSYQGTASTNPTSCFCFDQGEVTLKAWFERNVCFEGESIKVEIEADNSLGYKDIQHFLIALVQYTFISANNGVSRTYKKTIQKHQVSKMIHKGDKGDAVHVFTIPPIAHQTAISTLVANYYRLEVSTSLGSFVRETPCIYAPLFILKKSFQLKSSVMKKIHSDPKVYKTNKPVLFRAPQYWFKKNRNLSVMNFKQEDFITASYLGSEVN